MGLWMKMIKKDEEKSFIGRFDLCTVFIIKFEKISSFTGKFCLLPIKMYEKILMARQNVIFFLALPKNNVLVGHIPNLCLF